MNFLALRAMCTSVAGRYAYALFEAALSRKRLVETLAECEEVLELFSVQSPCKLLVTQALQGRHPEAWTKSFERSLGLQEFVLNFLRILAKRRRLHLLKDIVRLLRRLVDEHLNRVALTVISAVPLTATQKKNLIQRLSRYFQKELLLTYQIDSRVLGGFVVQSDTLTLDASARRFISQFVQEAQEGFAQSRVRRAG